MRRLLGALALAAILSANLYVFFHQPRPAHAAWINGIKGSVNGTTVCHCPDDKKNCKCHVGFE